jgi:arylsulfatase I/J
LARALPTGPDALPAAAPRTGAPRPHIVLFVVDDLGHANVGFSGHTAPDNTHTPHFDAAASSGIVLQRHYTFRWCAPTRAALMTGREPYHVLQATTYVSGGMNMIPAKLAQVGYATHQVGKWHQGCLLPWMTPAGRGFNSSFGFLEGGEDHYTHRVGAKAGFGCAGTDLWDTSAPANKPHYNGTYSAFLYNDRVQSIISQHDAARPLFLYVATQDAHAPDEAPSVYSHPFRKHDEFTPAYAIYNGMAAAADDLFGNMTTALKAKGMWNNTLVVMTSDNGGPASVTTSGLAANNWPYRGGKKTDFEGGIRVAAFVSGGFVPLVARGTVRGGYVHAADWFPTFCTLGGGVDCNDTATAAKRKVPAVDGSDMWAYLSGKVASSPRTEIMVSRCEHPNQHKIPDSKLSPDCSGALISKNHKLVLGAQYYGFWQGPVYPNASTDHSTFDHFVDCGLGCVFDIEKDPAETVDLAKANPDLLQLLRARFFELNATQFDAPRLGTDTARCEKYAAAHDGCLGPYYHQGS